MGAQMLVEESGRVTPMSVLRKALSYARVFVFAIAAEKRVLNQDEE
jgi:hypothetical protein